MISMKTDTNSKATVKLTAVQSREIANVASDIRHTANASTMNALVALGLIVKLPFEQDRYFSNRSLFALTDAGRRA